MQSFFNPDNHFWNFINKIIGLVVLSMVFTLCCLPIVTIGPACAAVYYAVVKSIRRERSYYITEFFRAFRSNLKSAIPANLILLALTIMTLLTDIPAILGYLSSGEIANIVTIGFFLIKVSLLLGISSWLYPLMSRFDQKLNALFPYALLMLVRQPISSIFIIILLLVSIVLVVIEPLLLAIIPGVCTLLISFRVEPVLQHLCEGPEDPNDDSWYLGR